MYAGSPFSTLLMVLKIAPVKRRSKKLVPFSSGSPVASKKDATDCICHPLRYTYRKTGRAGLSAGAKF
jgi:hypothetical protein